MERLSNATVRCCIYARFSSDMQSKHSAEDQIRECNEYAKRQGWTVVLVERDEAVRAGAMASRDGYARAMKAANQGAFDALLVFEISRFSRDFLDGMVELQKITKAKVKIADTTIGLVDLDTPHGQMIVSVHLMGAHQDVRKLAQNSKRGLKGKVLKGFSGGGLPAYGYRRVPVFSKAETDVDGRPKRVGVRLEPDLVAAPIVFRIFKLYDDGCAKSEIARKLNDERIASRDAGRIREGRTNSGTWAAASIKKILANAIYVGERIWNKHSRVGDKLPGSGKKAMRANPESEWIRVTDYAPPIVERACWNRVQERLASDRAEYAKKHTGNKNRRYLLSGFLSCSVCGGSFTIGSHFRGQKQYRCSMRASRGKTVCSNKTCVPQEALEARIKLILDAMSKDPDKLRTLVAEHNNRIAEFNAEHTSGIARMEKKLAEVAASAERLVDAIAAGEGEPSRLTKKLAALEAEESELKTLVDKARSEIQPFLIPRPLAVTDFLRGAASVFTGEYVGDRAFLERVVERVAVHAEGTLVLHFRGDSLFGLLSTYEIRRDGADPRVGRSVSLDQPLHRLKGTGLAASQVGPSSIEGHAIDFGGGVVAFYDHPRRNTVSVPSGI